MRADVATALIAPGPPAVLPPTRPPCPILPPQGGLRNCDCEQKAHRALACACFAAFFALRRCCEKVSPDAGARAGTSLLIPATGG